MFGGNLQYDYRFMSATKVGRFGYKESELTKLAQKLRGINNKLKNVRQEDYYSFRQLPYDKNTLRQVLKVARYLKTRYDNLVVVGIGGSDLGSRALYQALAGNFASILPKKWFRLKLYFIGDTTDPQPLADLLKTLDLKKTVFYVVSKSGETIEPLSNFLYLRRQLIKKVGYKRHQSQIIITTNKEKGLLWAIAQKDKYLVLPHYAGGGRFSALSVNGLLPLAVAGFDIERLLAGAKAMDKLSKKDNYKKNLPFIFAGLQYLAYTKRKQNIAVVMPYVYALSEFGRWYRQLWAESIGNKYDLKQKKVNVGITPIAALGPADQHSQIQLYIEGPYDKIINFIKVNQTNYKLKVPNSGLADLAYLANKKLADIVSAEQLATAVSLMKSQRPNGTIILPKLNEYYLWQLIYFFEMAVVYLGELLGVNVFEQPGVEHSKKIMYGLLGRPDYEKYKKEII